MTVFRTFLLSLISILALNVSAQVSFGNAELINDGWKFSLSDPKEAFKENFDDSRWQNVDLPHDWSVRGQLSPTLASCTGYLPGGIGWYRKSLNINADTDNKNYYIYFEGVYNHSEVFVNGHSLGMRPNGYISFMYDLTPYLKKDGKNIIAVKVDHSKSADSRWYTGSGIYRDVYLVEANPTHIEQWGVYARPENVTKKQATLRVEVSLVNKDKQAANLEVKNELVSANGKVVATSSKKVLVEVGKSNKATVTMKVSKPALWSLDTPNLYTLNTTIYQNGKKIDASSTKTGFRTYTFDPNKGFALNGVSMKVKGVCIHHDAGVLGSAVPRNVWKQRLLTLKEIGCNAVRTSHNPQAPVLYELCDELGLLVLNEAYDEWEFPKRKWLEGWNVGTPGFQGNYEFFEEWGEKDLRDMVLRDRNHISVFAWSIGNEVDYPNDPYSHPVLGGEKATGFTQAMYGGYKPEAPDAMRLGGIAKRLAAVVRQYDNRSVTAGLAGVAMSNETEYPGALDIAGYNYTESRYQTDHKKYPNRVLFGSENRHDLPAWYAVKDNEHIFGQFLWTGIDYLGESGRWPSRGFYSGLIDFKGDIKPRGYYRMSLWSEKPMAYLGSYPTPGKGSISQNADVWSALESSNTGGDYVEKVPSMDAWPVWNYNEGQSIRVVCYTNSNQAQLLLNGQVVGQTKPYDKETGIIYWDIPYKAGKLEVIGMDANGKEIARHSIATSLEPASIELIPEAINNSLKVGDVAEVVLQIVDKNGVPVMIADNQITCDIAGPGRLLGMEAGNNSDMGDYTDKVQRVFNGKMKIYIKAIKEGEINVRLTSPWIKTATTKLQISK